MKKEYWLVTTEHLEDRIWFRKDEDFKVGMNKVAILSASLPLLILAFILMSNHVHFVLECSYIIALEFITRFKRQYSKYYSDQYGKGGRLLLDNKVDIRPVSGEESLEKSIAYTQMNSVAANICLNAADYPWGSGDCFFNLSRPVRKAVGQISGRNLSRILHSRLSLPQHYQMDERGFIHPSSYIPVGFVEELFRTPKRMQFFLNSSSKARMISEAPSFKDQVVLDASRDLCVSLFRKRALSELTEKENAELLKQLRYRLSSDPKQLARVTGVSYEKACELLESN